MTGGPPLPDLSTIGLSAVELSDSSVASLRDGILAWYLTEGYPFARLGMRVDPSGALAVRAVSGRHAALEEVRFDTLRKTSPGVLLRLLEMEVGQPYESERIARWRRRMEKLDYVAWVGDSRLALGPMGNMVLIQEIEEAPAGHFAASMGYSGSGVGDELEGGGEVITTNLLGTGRTLELSARKVDYGGVDASLRYREPWIFGIPLSVEVRAAQEIPDSAWVTREGELVLVWEAADFETWAGVGTWRGYPPGLPDQSYSYGLLGISTKLGRKLRQGWEGVTAGVEARMGEATEVDSVGGSSQASAELSARLDEYTGALGLGLGVNAAGILEGQWLDGRLWRLGGAESLRGYPEGIYTTGRYVVARPEISVGETSTRAYVFGDLSALDTGDYWTYPVGVGVGVRGKAGLFGVDASVGFPVRDGLDLTRLYLSAVARII
ncbi:hypothetical protein GF402_08735 [Candidatus Fermentibacteria bacterium]|nr:hypothetical protein [Candidatus Fermentibacteria bacterium]